MVLAFTRGALTFGNGRHHAPPCDVVNGRKPAIRAQCDPGNVPKEPLMSKSIRTVLTAVAATVSLACLAAPAMADTPWQAQHPRREEVNNRLANQHARIHQEVREGEMSH